MDATVGKGAENHEGKEEAMTELTDDINRSNPIPSTTSGEGFIFITFLT